MKKVKNYIAPDLAKKKIARYKYWNIKDESGISITSSEDITDGRSFGEVLDAIISDNVDAEVQVKFGTNEQSSRQNAPIFIRINETIEWVEPEEEETININGVAHKVDKNGNVNINFSSPQDATPIIEAPSDIMRQEMEIQLEGLRKESELKEQRYQSDLHNKLAEQTLKFKEMMLSERESRIAEREQDLTIKESIVAEKEAEMTDQLKGYVKLIPSTLGGVINEWIKTNPFGKKTPLGTVEKEKSKQKPKPRNPVQFSIDEPEENELTEDNELLDIAVYDHQEVDQAPEVENSQIENNTNDNLPTDDDDQTQNTTDHEGL
ncbi:hypothetical protein [Aquimarina longa]|uniref:hypothetical protein n=1 Tax=Aquimarina longa TaxID=1080221 RepID=UPI000783F1AB|nr:hypothetical protein [Aquimarina longa]